MANKEIWKDIDGYEGLYQVSNMGRVKSLDAYVNSHYNIKRWRKGKVLKMAVNTSGYPSVGLSKDGITTTRAVHRIVASAFIPNHNNFPQVNHINGIKTDNRAENLEWVTNSENQKHAFANGLSPKKTGEKNHNASLSDFEATQIRNEYVPYSKEYGRKAIAEKYGVSVVVIKRIVNGKTYKN